MDTGHKIYPVMDGTNPVVKPKRAKKRRAK